MFSKESCRHLDQDLAGLAGEEDVVSLLPAVKTELVGDDHSWVNLPGRSEP